MTQKAFAAIGLAGGTAGALDDIIHTNVSDGDIAFVQVKSTRKTYTFVYDSSSAAVENVTTQPFVVTPDSNGGNGRWLQQMSPDRGFFGTTVAMATTATGLNIYNTSADYASLQITGAEGSLYIDNNQDAGHIYIRTNAQGTPETQAVFNDDGDVELYYDGTIAFATTAAGASLYDTSGDDPILSFKDDAEATVATIAIGNGTFMTLNVIGQIGFKYSNAGAAELYYNGVKKIETTATGVTIGDGTATGLTISYTNDDVYLDQTDPDGLVYIRSRNAGDTATNNLFLGDPDGAVDLYYANVKALSTDATGAVIFDTSGSIPTLTFKTDGGVETGQFLAGSTSLSLETNGEICLLATKDGSTDLYYDNTRTFYTSSAGIVVTDGTYAGITLGYTADDAYLVNTDPDGDFYIQSRNAADAATNTLFKGDPDGSVDLYNAGIKVLSTFLNTGENRGGIQVFDDAGSKSATLYVDNDDGRVALYNGTEGGVIYINGLASGPTYPDMAVFDPAGRSDLYYAGTSCIGTSYQNGAYGIVYLQTGVKDLSGAGTPESAITAVVGSTYRRTDGGAGTSFYVKESGTGNTGWVGK